MNLRRAIEGEPQPDRQKTLMPDYFCMDEKHENMLKAKGKNVLIKSGAARLLTQLAELVAEQGIESVVDAEERLMADGTVERMLGWEPGQWDGVCNNRNAYKGVTIRARSLTGDVFVQGRETEIISRSTWRTDREAMVRAIADAYRNPALISWPPVQIG